MKRNILTLLAIAASAYAAAGFAAGSVETIRLAQQSVTTQGGQTATMPGRESHKKEHAQGQQGAGAEAKPVTTQSEHTSDMPGRESHKKEHMKKKAPKPEAAPAAGAPPVSTSEHTAGMPGRESHKKEHEKK